MALSPKRQLERTVEANIRLGSKAGATTLARSKMPERRMGQNNDILDGPLADTRLGSRSGIREFSHAQDKRPAHQPHPPKPQVLTSEQKMLLNLDAQMKAANATLRDLDNRFRPKWEDDERVPSRKDTFRHPFRVKKDKNTNGDSVLCVDEGIVFWYVSQGLGYASDSVEVLPSSGFAWPEEEKYCAIWLRIEVETTAFTVDATIQRTEDYDSEAEAIASAVSEVQSLGGGVQAVILGTVTGRKIYQRWFSDFYLGDAELTNDGYADGGDGGGSLPNGIVAMWTSNDPIPDNWFLCDGSAIPGAGGVTTPDMRGYFVVGYDDRYGTANADPADNVPAHSDASYNTVGGTGGHLFEGLTENDHPDHAWGHIHTVTITHTTCAEAVSVTPVPVAEEGTYDTSDIDTLTGTSVDVVDSPYDPGAKVDDATGLVHRGQHYKDSNGFVQSDGQYDGGGSAGTDVDNRPPFYVVKYIMHWVV